MPYRRRDRPGQQLHGVDCHGGGRTGSGGDRNLVQRRPGGSLNPAGRENIAGVTTAVAETLQSAAQVERASTDIAAQTDELRKTVDRFLSDVTAA